MQNTDETMMKRVKETYEFTVDVCSYMINNEHNDEVEQLLIYIGNYLSNISCEIKEKYNKTKTTNEETTNKETINKKTINEETINEENIKSLNDRLITNADFMLDVCTYMINNGYINEVDIFMNCLGNYLYNIPWEIKEAYNKTKENKINEELNDKFRENALFDSCDFLMELISTYSNYLIEKKNIKELSKMIAYFETYFETVPENIKEDYEAYIVKMNELDKQAELEAIEILTKVDEMRKEFEEDMKKIVK